jgi:hypothetical protein
MPLNQKISEAASDIARINGIIAKIDVALALPDLFMRDPRQAPSSARRARVPRMRCSAPKTSGKLVLR